MLDRAYSVLEVKSVDSERRTLRGIATTPSTDRMGDVVEPLGVQYRNPLKLLWQHDKNQPIGHVTFGKPTADGISFEANIVKIDEPGRLKDRVDEAWQSVKHGLVSAVSIGFKPLEYSPIKGGGIRFSKSEVIELSLVTIPANADATITTIRSLDNALLAATGRNQSIVVRRDLPPGASGSRNPKMTPQEGNDVMTYAEQIAAFEATRVAKSARMDAIQTKVADEGRTKDDAEREEFDTLDGEIKSIDRELVDLRIMDTRNAQKAVPVTGVKDVETGSQVRGGVRVEVRSPDLPKGTAFTRYVMSLARSRGNLMQAAEIANEWKDSTPEVETVLRAAVHVGTTTGTGSAGWGAELVPYMQMASEFIELLRPMTVLGRLPNLRRVPFNISMPLQLTGSSTGWVGEGLPKPVSALSFDTVTLRWAKAAGIVVLTDELVRFSNPSAEAVVRGDLAASMTQFLDQQFLNPAVAGTPNVSPESITHAAAGTDTASGTTADDLRTDVKAAFAQFLAANLSPAGSVWIMQPTLALSIGMLLNPLGQAEFPGIDMNGGNLFGLPVVTSESSPTGQITLVKPSEVFLADDGGIAIDASREASLKVASDPGGADAAAAFVSLWQTNMVGVRAERYINWQLRRAAACYYITAANYGG